MGNRQSDGVFQTLRQLVEGEAAQLTDGQLLRRFAAYRDERAFAALLQRHGRLVYGVCRNILRHEHDAEDAFQGTFLVLARRAGAIRGDAVGSWLYRVAYRVAMKARQAAERRRQQEARAATAPSGEDRFTSDLAWRELQAMLDEELNRLPEKYRAPFVLCCLTGKSKSEAAAELGWKEGTVSSRLAHARYLLQTRLARRGVALSAILSGLAIAQPGSASVVPAGLVSSTQVASVAFAAGEPLPGTSPLSAGYARSVLSGMNTTRLKIVVALLALAGVLGSTAAVALRRSPAPDTPPPHAEIAALTPPPNPVPVPPDVRPAADDHPAPGTRMTVRGFVVGPEGRPVPGVAITVTAERRHQPGELRVRGVDTVVLGTGQTDDQGRYQLSVPQTTRHHSRLIVFAAAPGYAPVGQMADFHAITDPEHNLPLRMIRGHTVRARVVTPDGQPAAGVKLHLLAIDRPVPHGLALVFEEPPVPLSGWPNHIVTDAEGLFALPDVAPDTRLVFQVRDERYATAWLVVESGKEEAARPVELALSPPRVLEGRIIAEDTGAPLTDASILVETVIPLRDPKYWGYTGYVKTRTDREGRYRVRPFAGRGLRVSVYPVEGQPYLALRKEQLEWPEEATAHRVDLSVPRGILVRGTVTEQGTGRPVAGAGMRFQWGITNNPYWKLQHGEGWWLTQDARTGPDGAFTLTLPPGPGMLRVKAAEPEYVLVETGLSDVDGQKGGRPYFSHAAVPLSLQPTREVHELGIQLRRGATLRGRVVGPDGQPVASALLVSPSYVLSDFEMRGDSVAVRNGRFELPGCDPDKPVNVWVYDATNHQGAVAELPVGATEPEVRLAPCVSARLRIVDTAGRSVTPTLLMPELVLRPGDDGSVSSQKGVQAGLSLLCTWVHGRGYRPIESGAGRYELPQLIPGANYAIRAQTPNGAARMSFTAPLTGSVSLADLIIPDAPRRK